MKKRVILNLACIILFYGLTPGQGTAYCGPFTGKSPIAWNKESNKTISGFEISNAKGHCITLTDCSNITIQNCKLGPSKHEGVYLYHCKNITIQNCTMDSVDSGVVADSCTGIAVIHNDIRNVLGPLPRGQMVQFGRVYGRGNRINYNDGENLAGQSNPEDEISLYRSNGTAEDPIQVIGNRIRGGGPSTSGGGIMAGDNGGSYIVVKNNILVDPGQYGITIASGHHITIENNKIYGRQQPFSNVGLSIWNQYQTDCSSNTIRNNEVNFTNKSGHLNCFWNKGNCGEVTGWKTNYYNPELKQDILPAVITGKCHEEKAIKTKNKK